MTNDEALDLRHLPRDRRDRVILAHQREVVAVRALAMYDGFRDRYGYANAPDEIASALRLEGFLAEAATARFVKSVVSEGR